MTIAPERHFTTIGYVSTDPNGFEETTDLTGFIEVIEQYARTEALARSRNVNFFPSINPDVDRTPQARAGIELLDRIKPDWLDRIDMESLDVASEKQCLLGQVFGTYTKGVEAMVAAGEYGPPSDYGFALCGVGSPAQVTEAYERLTDNWKEELSGRKETAA